MRFLYIFALAIALPCTFGQGIGFNRTSKNTAPTDLNFRGASYRSSGGGLAGHYGMGEGTAPSAEANMITLYAPPDVDSAGWRLMFPAASGTGMWLGTASGGIVELSFLAFTGTGDAVRANSPTLVTPVLGAATATTPSPGDNSTRVATTEAVKIEIDPYRYEWIGAEFDGHGDVIESGKESDPIYFDRACTIVEWVMTSDVPGSFIVDILRKAGAWDASTPPVLTTPPVDADSIAASARPTLSSQQGVRQTDLSGFSDVTLDAGDTIVFKADSASTTLTRSTVLIRVRY